MCGKLTIGPILFHWSAEKKRDFYFRIADESPVDSVYIGEVVCSKRAPFFENYYDEVSERLKRGGKKVVFSSLAEVMIMRERKMTEGLCALDDFQVEANDASALYHLRGRLHRVGQYFNVYNEETLKHLAGNGATHISLPAELPADSLSIFGKKASDLRIALEVQVYGRVGLALSARCYHARSHGKTKDSCQFVCEEDPDGMTLRTIDKVDFLCVNGVQTLSYKYLNLIQEIQEMSSMGIEFFRLSPHSGDMIRIISIYDDVIANRCEAAEALKMLSEVDVNVPYANGFFHHTEGHKWVVSQ